MSKNSPYMSIGKSMKAIVFARENDNTFSEGLGMS